MVEQKNQIEILSALVELKTLIKNFRLLILGYGPEKKNLQKYAQNTQQVLFSRIKTAQIYPGRRGKNEKKRK